MTNHNYFEMRRFLRKLEHRRRVVFMDKMLNICWVPCNNINVLHLEKVAFYFDRDFCLILWLTIFYINFTTVIRTVNCCSLNVTNSTVMYPKKAL